mmetsp:Transcript_43740/g.133074  ORF Transcript_43740/g.133074 Transcript_43740/m.133074 type:complete len:234 (+) Transcript_43740:2184-2885(+)
MQQRPEITGVHCGDRCPIVRGRRHRLGGGSTLVHSRHLGRGRGRGRHGPRQGKVVRELDEALGRVCVDGFATNEHFHPAPDHTAAGLASSLRLVLSPMTFASLARLADTCGGRCGSHAAVVSSPSPAPVLPLPLHLVLLPLLVPRSVLLSQVCLVPRPGSAGSWRSFPIPNVHRVRFSPCRQLRGLIPTYPHMSIRREAIGLLGREGQFLVVTLVLVSVGTGGGPIAATLALW